MVPPMGSEDWSLVVTNRSTGRAHRAWGTNQSIAMAVLTARIVDTLATTRPMEPVTITAFMTLHDIAAADINVV